MSIKDKIVTILEKPVLDKTTNAGYLIFLLLIITISANAVIKPSYNWDLIGYIGAVCSINETNALQIQDKTFEAVKLSVPDSIYNKLTRDDPIRIKSSSNAVYFNSVIDYYKVKPLYVWIVYLLHKTGFNIVLATVIPSVFSYFLLMIIFYNWIGRYLRGYQTLIVSAATAVVRPLSELAKFSTPDMLSSLLLFYALYLIAFKKNDLINMPVLFILSVLARPDNFVFWLVLIILFVFLEKNAGKKKLIYSGAALLITGAFLLFVFAFDRNAGWLNKYTGIVFQASYLENLKKWVSDFRGSLLFYSLGASFLILAINGFRQLADRMRNLFLACIAFIVIKFLIYPFFEERYFILSSMFFIVFIVYSLTEIKSALQDRTGIIQNSN